MNILTKLSKAFQQAIEQVQLEQAKLADGTVIEADSFEVGLAVFVPVEDGESIPLPEGKYELDNGNTISVDGNGVIVALEPTEAMDEEVAEEAAPEMAEAEVAAPVAKKVIESQVKETIFSKVEMSAVQLELSNAQAEIETLKETVKSLELEKATLQESLDNEPAAAPLSRSPQSGTSKLQSEVSGEMKLSAKQAMRNRIINRINS